MNRFGSFLVALFAAYVVEYFIRRSGINFSSISSFFSLLESSWSLPASLTGKKTLDDVVDLRDKRVLVHVSLSEARPIDDRLRERLPTITEVFNKGAKAVVWIAEPSHRPDGLVIGAHTWTDVADRLSKLTRRPVKYLDSGHSTGVEEACAEMQAGSILLVDETTAFGDSGIKSKLGDVYVLDMMISRLDRPHPASVGLCNKGAIPCVAGRTLVMQLRLVEAITSGGGKRDSAYELLNDK